MEKESESDHHDHHAGSARYHAFHSFHYDPGDGRRGRGRAVSRRSINFDFEPFEGPVLPIKENREMVSDEQKLNFM